jgi:hypothetical protein
MPRWRLVHRRARDCATLGFLRSARGHSLLHRYLWTDVVHGSRICCTGCSGPTRSAWQRPVCFWSCRGCWPVICRLDARPGWIPWSHFDTSNAKRELIAASMELNECRCAGRLIGTKDTHGIYPGGTDRRPNACHQASAGDGEHRKAIDKQVVRADAEEQRL